ncbi:TetR/AcrR family transcriptional regulator [Staphylococcus saprophyticus]|nr:TetR/AcrR family transcriptional regulator [Staphylococcus arlettae]ARO44700.1 Transcriptional regulator, TetR family [Staphylococcus arlettae]MCD9065404.1 TetR/AcrR family transcriptional regulator [Staphylococcus saprophyticus]
MLKEGAFINSIFNKLKKDKQKMIVNASIKEFIKSGFDKASTNEIVKQAHISKGSLFNYFNSKKELYCYLISYSTQILENMYEEIDLSETDLFNRIENIGLQKLYVQQNHPEIFDFLKSTIEEESLEIKSIIEQHVSRIYEDGRQKIYANIDYSKFRDDIDIDKAIEILNWTMYGFGQKGLQQINSFENLSNFGERYLKEWNIYAQILKHSFYKEDEV